MKNIYEILKSLDIEIPENKKESFDKEVNANYKTIKEVESIREKITSAEEAKTKFENDLKQRDKDLANLKKQLEDAGADKGKLEDITDKLNTLQSEYDQQQKKYAKD